MRKTIAFSALAALVLGSGLLYAAPAKSSANTIVIVFKDGHRQSFSLADIERIEFPGGSVAPSSGENEPPRGRYVGKWEVGDGAGNDFTISLNEDGSAFRSLGDVHGRWNYVDGDALITWDDGNKDAIRRSGSRYQKSAYMGGKSFGDKPDNVTAARNVTPKPI